MTYKINANALTSDGRNVATGTVVSFTPHTDAITTSGLIPTDLNWWISEAAKTAAWAKITPCTDAVQRVQTQLVNVYLQITVPVDQLSYSVIQGYGLTWLEGIYGSGNVQILN